MCSVILTLVFCGAFREPCAGTASAPPSASRVFGARYLERFRTGSCRPASVTSSAADEVIIHCCDLIIRCCDLIIDCCDLIIRCCDLIIRCSADDVNTRCCDLISRCCDLISRCCDLISRCCDLISR
ncbi:hypothetical protein NQZ68_033145 [Dissostichus eleginoides]|nr:hypothetical protein NQZ68_033145 [Dissostichus eleginoides]